MLKNMQISLSLGSFPLDSKNLVYAIECSHCGQDAGERGSRLRDRLQQHLHTFQSRDPLTLLAKHFHQQDWKQTPIGQWARGDEQKQSG